MKWATTILVLSNMAPEYDVSQELATYRTFFQDCDWTTRFFKLYNI